MYERTLTVEERMVVEQALVEFAERAYAECEKYDREDPSALAKKSYKYNYKSALDILADFFHTDLRADYNIQ